MSMHGLDASSSYRRKSQVLGYLIIMCLLRSRAAVAMQAAMVLQWHLTGESLTLPEC